MSELTFAQSINAINKFAQQHPTDQINVQLHGGEPLLYGIKNLQLFVSAIAFEPNIKVSITTNLLRGISHSNQLAIDLFKMMKPYDDTPFIMSSWDWKIRFLEYYSEDVWWNNVKICHDNGIIVQPIVCLTKLLLEDFTPVSLFQMFTQKGIHHINFERLTPTGRLLNNMDLIPKNKAVDEWLSRAWKASYVFGMNIPLFESMEDSLNGTLDGCRARQCMKTVITINPDGTLAACPNKHDGIIGKLTDDGFSFDEEKIKSLCKFEQSRPTDCYICKHFKYCNGDCCQLMADDSGCQGLPITYSNMIE